MSSERFPRLHPAQVCFVVDDVDRAVDECVAAFGWGPFTRFTAPVAEAHYREWSGPKETEVALGMAGGVQVELIHVNSGRDTVAEYQTRFGRGFQHLGISCRDRDEARAALESIGSRVDDEGEYPGVRIAFMDTPTGPGMFELLESVGEGPPGSGSKREKAEALSPPRVELDRATIVTADLDRALAFYRRAFRWEAPRIESRTLRFEQGEGQGESQHRRVRGEAGQLHFELVEAKADGDDPYARHLARGDHGLVHAGGFVSNEATPPGISGRGEWLEDGEAFTLHAWSGGEASLQIRTLEGATS